jgi:hypothetical protein
LFFGPAAFGGKANNIMIFLKRLGLLALVPQASKKRLANENTSGSL